MTDTVISDAEPSSLDEGVGSVSDGNERWYSAGFIGTVGMMVGQRGYIYTGLDFTGHDGTADTVDLSSGLAYVMVSSVDVQSALGGSSEPSFDLTLPMDVPVGLVVPTGITSLDLSTGTLNDVWIALDTDGTGPGGSPGDIYVRHGTGLSAPTHPSVQLGEVNPDDSTADRRYNDTPGQGMWTRDGNSPNTFNGVNLSDGGSATYTLDTPARHVKLVAAWNPNTGGSNAKFEAQFNGVTTDYYTTSSSGLSRVGLAYTRYDNQTYVVVEMQVGKTGGLSGLPMTHAHRPGFDQIPPHFGNQTITDPMSSITFGSAAGDTGGTLHDVHVYYNPATRFPE